MTSKIGDPMRKKFDCNDIRDFLTPKNKPEYMMEGCGSEISLDLEATDPVQLCSKFLGAFRGMQIWFHSAHVMTKGTAFAGDHVLLYGKIYEEISDQLDHAMEKVLGLTNEESLLCPKEMIKSTQSALDLYDSPSDSSAYNIATTALKLVENFLTVIEILYKVKKHHDLMTLGLEDFMSSLANTHEGYVYQLQQRVKTHLN